MGQKVCCLSAGEREHRSRTQRCRGGQCVLQSGRSDGAAGLQTRSWRCGECGGGGEQSVALLLESSVYDTRPAQVTLALYMGTDLEICDYKLSSEYLALCSEQTHSYRFGPT